MYRRRDAEASIIQEDIAVVKDIVVGKNQRTIDQSQNDKVNDKEWRHRNDKKSQDWGKERLQASMQYAMDICC